MKTEYTDGHIDTVVERLEEYRRGIADPDYRWSECNVCESCDNDCDMCIIYDCSFVDGTDLGDRPPALASINSGSSGIWGKSYTITAVQNRYNSLMKRANDNLEKSGSEYLIVEK